MKKYVVLTIVVLALVSNSLCAAPDPGDSSLRLWLKADAGVTVDGSSNVLAWADQRTGSSIVAGPNDAGKPKLLTITTPGGRTFKTVRFGAFGNTGFLVIPNDGLQSFVIGGDMSMIVVFNPLQNGDELPSATYHTLVALRGTQTSQYHLGLQSGTNLVGPNGNNVPVGGAFTSVFYKDPNSTIMNSTRRVAAATWHIAHMKITGNTVNWYYNTGAPQYKAALESGGSDVLDPNHRAVATTDALCVGNHLQANVKEPFSGDIAEVLIYNKALSAAEAQAITDYLYDKYFKPVTCGDLGAVYLAGDTIGTVGTGPVASDPNLRLWLKGDTYNFVASPRSATWTDSSSYGTQLGIQTTGEAASDPNNHTPPPVTVTNGGRTFKAVQFRQAYDPVTFNPTTGHLSDRLYQKTNIGAGDPTNIGNTKDITLLMALRVAVPDAGLGPFQTILAKRGPAPRCTYSLNYAYANSTGTVLQQMQYFTYTSGTAGGLSGLSPVPAKWAVVQMNITTGGVLTFKDYFTGSSGWRTSTQSGIARAAAFPDASDTPLSLAFHMQAFSSTIDNPWGNGSYERFAGDIAEVILYAKSLSAVEEKAMQDYLVQKYLSDLPDCKLKMNDFAKMAAGWLDCSTPGVVGCL